LRLIIYTGKGGTGKTVTSCATAINLAEKGYKTILISADPAHTISDALCIEIGHCTKKISPNLEAIEIDPLFEISKNYMDIISSISSSFIGKISVFSKSNWING
jgi:arsenite-transporting ATPase